MRMELRLLAFGLGFVAATALQLQQAELWAVQAYRWMTLAGVGFLTLGWRRSRWWLLAWSAALLSGALLGAGQAGWRAHDRLSEQLPADLEGRDLVVTGVIDGLPQEGAGRWRFRFEIESAHRQGDPTAEVALPRLAMLGWYAQADGSGLAALRAGERWRFTVRLKRPHGLANPHGFDHELWLFEQGVRATGYVRPASGAAPRRLAGGVGHPVDRARQWVRDAIAARVADARAAAVLAALAVGEQAAIDRDDWALYRDTAVAHLMSISGVHVTMFAWLAGGAIGWAWRRSERAMLHCPAPTVARWGGLAAALAYAVFAGFGVPAQRTVVMLATAGVLRGSGFVWPWPLVMGAAALAVTAFDPWALLQPGFWLSFGAVALLLASGESRAAVAASSGLDDAPRWSGLRTRLASLLAGGLRTQLVATVGLAPLSLICFQQLSGLGFVANLVAIPLVTLAITPLSLLGIGVPPLWPLAAWLVDALNAALALLQAHGGAVLIGVAAAPPWAVACGLLGALLAIVPLPWALRGLAVVFVLPLAMPPIERVAPGELSVLAADVGQGTAVLLRTADHALLYDAGPQYSREADAGERVLRPLLRALGVVRLDAMMLSHRDNDHTGGARALLDAVPIQRLSSSLEAAHPLLALARERGAQVERCESGRRWQWDGVAFELLHPGAERLDAAQGRPNARSCVLAVTAANGRRVLLTGDIERAEEAALRERVPPEALRADVLLVPHHGSRTSSSDDFLDAVRPDVAVVQAGYRNRFGHPAAEVTDRYRRRGISLVETARCGAWRIDAQGPRCERALSRRYWHHPQWQDGLGAGPRADGLEVAIPVEDQP
ncbi:DNA internalization-related competence protein ComEC/Rec2 [Caldimonas sp. KR1-144]|uniref:DNA internalization-related competence protein ComEC/Rec2 n=1 Tax=Caldimonas sp. KR1-144 TaxID=3400911 RepID=UPI003C068636